MKQFEPSDAELEILQLLWADQPASVRQLFDQIQHRRKVSYTTVLTVMQRMTDKGLVERTKEGKAHLYRAVPREQEVQKSLSQRLLKTAYKGSALHMALHALGQNKVSPEELAELQQWLNTQTSTEDE
ncbi:MAG: BlaI/MecI/CopY family transcriptional regulator [Bacteroidota bacterium]